MKISVGFLLICIIVVVESFDGVNKKSPTFSSIANTVVRSKGQLGIKIPPKKFIDTSFLVSVRYQRTHICQGAIVGSRLVVVPAHCVNCQRASQSDLQVFTDTEELHDEINVSKIKCPDQNSSDAVTYLWLSRPIQEDQQIINLPELQLADNNFVPGDQVHSKNYAYGWGLNGNNSNTPERIETSIAPKNKCRTVDYGYLDSQKYICTHKKKFNICQDNNDIVLVSNNTLIGIATKIGCQSKVNVFSRLSGYLPMLNSNDTNDDDL